MAALYELPSKANNPCWPMPLDYERTVPYVPKSSRCQRCDGVLDGTKHRACPNCRHERKRMRKELMGGWYNPEFPGQLMRRDRPDIFLAAMNFGVMHYFRLSTKCRHEYFRKQDCIHRVRIQTMFTKPQSALIAPRGSGKTFTIVFEMFPTMLISRPNTPLLVGSETKDLTEIKLEKVAKRIEGNARIYNDYGFLWPQKRKSSAKWSPSKQLDFLNGSQLMGRSVGQSTRGLHPIGGVVDDGEGEDQQNSADARADFMKWLTEAYLNQFADDGTHVMIIGTNLHVDGDFSCIHKIVHNDDAENRWANWDREVLPMIFEDPPGSGKLISAWPEYLTVEQFEDKKRGNAQGDTKAVGLVAAMAEFQGIIVPRGLRMFTRDERKHGFIMWENEKGEKQIYDPGTGKSRTLKDLLDNSIGLCGVDVADQTKDKGGCKSGITVALYDSDGIWWFIDAWAGQVFSDETVRWMFRLCQEWKISDVGFEAAVLGKRVFRDAQNIRKQRLLDRLHVPRLNGLGTDGVAKELRIERMKPDFDEGSVKLPLFKPMDGYKPVAYPRRASLQELIDQFDSITIETRKGSFDLLDSAEMLHRITDKRPKAVTNRNQVQTFVDKMEKLGIELDPMQVPEEGWNKRMRQDFVERTEPDHQKVGVCDGFC